MKALDLAKKLLELPDADVVFLRADGNDENEEDYTDVVDVRMAMAQSVAILIGKKEQPHDLSVEAAYRRATGARIERELKEAEAQLKLKEQSK